MEGGGEDGRGGGGGGRMGGGGGVGVCQLFHVCFADYPCTGSPKYKKVIPPKWKIFGPKFFFPRQAFIKLEDIHN